MTDTTTVNVPDGCYTLIVGDTCGDGMAGSIYRSYGLDGDYEVQDAAGNVLTQMTAANDGEVGTPDIPVLLAIFGFACTNQDLAPGQCKGRSCWKRPFSFVFHS